jgi:hypothetical protein
MRAKEFTINIPITIHLDADGTPNVDMKQNPETTDQLDQNPVFVPPLQQAIELAKATLGKSSPVIDKITADHPDIGDEPEQNQDSVDLERIRTLASPSP